MLSYVGRTPPNIAGVHIPVPPEGALYYDYVAGVLYGSVPGLGEWFTIGGGSGSGIVAPIILTSEQFVNTDSTQTITITAPATQMYATSIYMNTPGTGSAGDTVTATLSYTAADGSGLQSIALILPLDTANVVMETYPLLVLGGTPISLTTAYGGAYTDLYTIGASIVQMPS
jgi:hypothetical protein